MDALLFELLPYVRQGYNCSQLLLVLAQRAAGEENPALLASVRGLGHGIGQSGGPCGLLSAGAVALTWLASPVAEEPHPMLDAMLNDYAWEQGWPELWAPQQLKRRVSLAMLTQIFKLVTRSIMAPKPDADQAPGNPGN